LGILKKYGVRYIDAAPTLLCKDIESANPSDITDHHKQYGIKIAAMQSLLYPFPSISLFDDASSRSVLMGYLRKVFSLSCKLGVQNLVFGSPKNRLVRDPSVFSTKVAVDIFREIAEAAKEYGCIICFEANPKEYGCNFMTGTQEAIEFVRTVNHDCFKLNLDVSTILLNGENLDSILADGRDLVQHIHLSSPFIRDIIGLDHSSIRSALEKYNYLGCLSMESMFAEDDDLLRLENNIRCFVENYKHMEEQGST
jgi:sugar phosphate isomerase/epimerase